MLTVLLDGVAYGMLLFVLACGLSVTLGLMNVVNLAHGAIAMIGGYVTVVAMNRFGVPFLACLPLAFAASALVGLVLERILYRRLYDRPHLEQVLFSIGLVFMAMSAVDFFFGASPQLITLPAWMRARVEVFGVGIGAYRLFVILVCAVVALGLQLVLARTRFGSQLRASVDDARVARGLGIRVGLVFAVTFAAGSGLAGLGAAIGADMLGMEPFFPIKYMIYFLIVVTVGGTKDLAGPFFASLLIGVGDVAGKYYVPEFGAFAIYTIMVVILIVRPQGLFGRAA